MRKPIELYLDPEGLWASNRVSGVPGSASRTGLVPGSSGISIGRSWEVPIWPGLPELLATLVERASPAPRRLLALAGLAAACMDACADGAVPERHGEGFAWRATPGPPRAQALFDAAAAARDAGVVFAAANPNEVIERFVAQLSAVLLGPVPEPVVAAIDPSGRRWTAPRVKAQQRWAGLVAARRAANLKVAIQLDNASKSEASDGSAGWQLRALAIVLDEPTSRFRIEDLRGSQLAIAGDLIDRWWTAEERNLRAALDGARGTRLSFGELTSAEVIDFLERVAPVVTRAGVEVLAPAGLLRARPVRRRIRAGASSSGLLSLDSLQLSATIEVDGHVLDAAELAQLAAAKSELVSLGGRWVRVADSERERIARLLATLAAGQVGVAELLSDEAFEGVEFAPFEGLTRAREVAVPVQIRATLRPYQITGLQWLTWLEDNGVGGILADDMGLGKTLQVIARIVADGQGPTLVVAPVTLVDTWLRQVEQFAPHLDVGVFHGNERIEAAGLAGVHDVVLTTYGLLARDTTLREVTWHRVVLDEAQAIKNPDTQVAKAARSLVARHRLAVTGTPVENHLLDLWSLMAFSTPGLLPRRTTFRRRFNTTDADRLASLRTLTAPFVLRRVKTDPGIAADLPDREVVRDDCALTREQVAAYEAAVKQMMEALARAADQPDTLGRRGSVLAGIGRLKQICVHPALLTESRTDLAGRSGKVARLVELTGDIVDEGQAVVVFTQFASFVPDLATHLGHELGVAVLTLTGADPRARRAAVVRRFADPTGPPVLIASLKAGGTGLTLVRANHVIHLDRWWNPAVEDQASDRVWRIGQTQKVTVHTLVCPGTLEERIDETLRRKREVAAALVRSTEGAITEMTDSELADLVSLVRDRVIR